MNWCLISWPIINISAAAADVILSYLITHCFIFKRVWSNWLMLSLYKIERRIDTWRCIILRTIHWNLYRIVLVIKSSSSWFVNYYTQYNTTPHAASYYWYISQNSNFTRSIEGIPGILGAFWKGNDGISVFQFPGNNSYIVQSSWEVKRTGCAIMYTERQTKRIIIVYLKCKDYFNIIHFDKTQIY